MPGGWRDSNRSAELPANWPAIRSAVLRRDGHQCTWLQDGTRCGAPADEVDHRHRGGGDHPSNLRALCLTHHRWKTSREGNAERWRYKQARPQEQHPGLTS